MKFFIDTANIAEIKEGLKLGMVDGVTTNPSLVAKENKPFDDGHPGDSVKWWKARSASKRSVSMRRE